MYQMTAGLLQCFVAHPLGIYNPGVQLGYVMPEVMLDVYTVSCLGQIEKCIIAPAGS